MTYDEREAARYLGVKTPTDELIEKIHEAAKAAEGLCPSYACACFDASATADGVFLQGTDVVLRGNLAKKTFAGCKRILVVLATLGLKSDVLLRRTFAVSAEKAVILDAVYTDMLEKYLDETEKALSRSYGKLTSRISCGYGDLPLATQKDLFALTEGERLGVKINECCMLVPNKSVIALLGVR